MTSTLHHDPDTLADTVVDEDAEDAAVVEPVGPPAPMRPAPGWIVEPPAPHRCAPVWDTPVPRPDSAETRAPLVWLLGAHGGAGVSTLTRSWPFAGDPQRRWPGRVGFTPGQDSPLVVVVARTAMTGLAAAHDLLLQHAAGATPTGVALLGILTVADTDRALARPVAARRDLVEHLATELGGQAWRLGWIEPWRTLTLGEVAAWTPGQPLPPDRAERRDPTRTAPLPVRHLGTETFRAAADHATTLRTPTAPTALDQPVKGHRP